MGSRSTRTFHWSQTWWKKTHNIFPFIEFYSKSHFISQRTWYWIINMGTWTRSRLFLWFAMMNDYYYYVDNEKKILQMKSTCTSVCHQIEFRVTYFCLLSLKWIKSSFENDGEMSIRAAWYIPSCLQITVAICCFTNANELVLPPAAAT